MIYINKQAQESQQKNGYATPADFPHLYDDKGYQIREYYCHKSGNDYIVECIPIYSHNFDNLIKKAVAECESRYH